MFSLLMTFLAIVLIGFVIVVASYYMGDGLFSAHEKATAVTVINGANQIDSAIKLYKTQHRGDFPDSIDVLVEQGYLKSAPRGEWSFSDGAVQNTDLTDEICEQVNERLHSDPHIPQCGETPYFMGCCSADG